VFDFSKSAGMSRRNRSPVAAEDTETPRKRPTRDQSQKFQRVRPEDLSAPPPRQLVPGDAIANCRGEKATPPSPSR